ncbi:MAG: M16 family metallopeptidase [bacterium]
MNQKHGNPLLPYTQQTLPSGLTLVHKEVRVAPIVAVDFWIHTGAVHDPEPHYGLSHFYEHMFFKGTERFGVGVMDRIITALGGYNNASTSLDFTHYYVVLPSAGWRVALEVLMDSLRRPLFDPNEIESERSVIVEEIKRHEDNPLSKIYDEFTQAAFARCPYSRRVLGTEESLQTITRETFLDYLHARYRLDNVTLCVVGDVSRDEITDAVHALAGEPDSASASPVAQAWEMIQEPREVTIQRDVNQAYLLAGYPTPSIIGTPDEYALDLLSIILGEGRSSRLHRRLHDELGLVSSISSSCWTLARAGLFLVEAVTDTDKLARVEAEIQSEIEKVGGGIFEDELRKAKNIARADFDFSNEKVINISNTYGYSRVTTDIEHAVHYLEVLESITLDQVRNSFETLLIPTRRCKGLLIPKNGNR